MDPKLWGALPPDLLELIADFADIDTRRALGFKPRKLRPMDFVPRPMPSVEYRYYTSEKKLWYFEMTEYHNFFFEVQTGVELVNIAVPSFRSIEGSRCRTVIYTEDQTEYSNEYTNLSTMIFNTAGHPIWIA